MSESHVERIELGEGENRIIPCVWKGDSSESRRIEIVLSGRGARAELLILIEGRGHSELSLETLVIHRAQDTRSRIVAYGVLQNNARADIQGKIRIERGAKNSDANLDARLLLMDDASGKAVPSLEIRENEVRAGHAASVGHVDEEAMFYLRSRGLDEKRAKQLIVEGFLVPMRRRIHGIKNKEI